MFLNENVLILFDFNCLYEGLKHLYTEGLLQTYVNI